MEKKTVKQESNPHKNTTKIKICGLKRKKDIEIVNKYRPDYIGFVFAGSKRKVTKEQATELRKMLNSDILAVGVFVNEGIDKIVDLVEDKVIDLIQLHGDEDKEYIIKLRDALSTKQIDAKIIKAIRVKSGDNVKEILMRNNLLIDDLLDENVQKNEKYNLSDKKRCFKNNYKLITQIDYILFDTYSSKEYGGTGQAFDWNILKDIKQPFFLAGGLNSENVNDAIKTCNPYVVDVSSAVETEGYKDEEKIKEFITKIKVKENEM